MCQRAGERSVLPPGSETQCTGPAPMWALQRSPPSCHTGGSGILKPVQGLLERAAAMGFCSQGVAPTCLRGGPDTGPPRDCPAVLVTEARHGDSMLDSGCPQMCQGQSVLRLLLLATGHCGVPPCCPSSLTEVAFFAEAKTDQADGPKEPPQSVRFVLGRGMRATIPRGPEGQ